ncbi:peptide-N-glycosidase F-related protein [Chitinophagaceae bacterium MMS25-I14]
MKKILFFLGLLASANSHSSAQTTIHVMDTVLFFDGYASTVSTPAPPAGVLRLRNDLYTRKLTTAELQSIGTTLQMNVAVKASCDNYDRIGNVNMVLAPKGAASYNTDSVQKIELGRYITPFMNKNAQPDSVPYTYSINNVAMLLKETSITTNYDIWIELELFGVPYAANTQIAGCSGRNDVFYGSVAFVTNSAAAAQNTNVLMPLSFKANFNNYQTGATDTVGKTTKTITFNVTNNLTDASLFLITSNHGANSGGEEYSRRNHFVYFDDSLRLTYKPGRTSCEPFRQYNTQSNGIYGSSVKSDAQWQSFSNWCPGDVISIRRIDLGPLAAGSHKFMITVPDAVFAGGQGNFPLSLYLQGKTSGQLSVENITGSYKDIKLFPNPATEQVTIENTGDAHISSVNIFNTMGACVLQTNAPSNKKETFSIGGLAQGLYVVYIKTDAGISVHRLEVIH